MSNWFDVCQADEEEKRRIQEDQQRADKEAKEAARVAELSRQRKVTEEEARAQREESERALNAKLQARQERLAAQEEEKR
jgi:hypothetical protein